jgi:plastocyanin
VRRLIALLAIGAATALAVAPVATAGKTPRKTVKVGDYFLSPGKITVKRGTRITWKWLNSNGDTHDVKLKKGPKGVKKFHSDYASTDFKFTRTLKKKGKYTVICTLHPTQMHQVITVK